MLYYIVFRGSLPPAVQQIFADAVKRWQTHSIYVGCSGNFTIERVLVSLGFNSIYANDVTLYSSVLGAYFASKYFRCEPKTVPGFEFLLDYCKTPEDSAASVMLVGRMTDAISTNGTLRDNPYYQRLLKAYIKQFPDLHAATVLKITSATLPLEDYYCGDVMNFIDMVPENSSVIMFPPFYAGDYTNMFKKLDLLFDWDKPSFCELNDTLLADLYKKVTSKRNWLFGTDTLQSDYESNLIGMAQTTNRGVPLYTYGVGDRKSLVIPNQQIEMENNARLASGQDIGNKMTISELNGGQFRVLRSQYMNEKIKPGQETKSYAISVDGYMVGVFAISIAPSKAASTRDVGTLYMLSDFPVSPTSYKRLAKLVLYAALSKEAQLLMERVSHKRVTELFTTAFSNNPESMKYRGVFTLFNRHELKEAERAKAYGNKFMLNYVARAGQWSLAEGLELWKKKHGVKALENSDNQD